MAFTYGSVTNCKVANGQTRSEYECRLGYEVQSQSIADNTSSVKLRLQVRSISSSYKTYGYNQTTKIDGTSLAAKEFDMRSTNTWQTFGERTITVTHNTNGTYSASKSGSFTTTASSGYSLKSGSASVTVAPATIPRYATSNQSVNSVGATTIVMNWWSDSTIDYLWTSLDNGATWWEVGSANGTSGTYNINNQTPGTTYNIKTRVRRKDSQLTTDSATLSVTTLGYASITKFDLVADSETSIQFTWAASKTCDAIQYSINGGSWTGGVFPTTYITGLAANTQYNVKIRVKAKDSQLWTESSVKYATTYSYPYCTSAPNFTIGNNVNLTFHNPLNRTMQIQMWSHRSGQFVSDMISVNGTSYSGFSNVASRLYGSIPNNKDSRYNIDVHYGGNKAIKEGGNYSIKGTEKPTFNDFRYEDTNAKTVGLTGNNQILISGYSNLKVTIPVANKAIGNNSANINKYRLNVGNMSSVEKDYSSTEDVAMSINSINSPSISVTALDSRELSTAVSKNATFKAYTKPVVGSFVATRSDGGVGDQVTLAFDGEWWNDNFGNIANSIQSVKYYYKATTSSTWIEGKINIIPTINGNRFSGSVLVEGPTSDTKGFDVSTAYNIKLIVTDQLTSSSEIQFTLGTGTPAIAICENKVAIGAKYDEELGGTLQVQGTKFSRRQLKLPNFSSAGYVKLGKVVLWEQCDSLIINIYAGNGQNSMASQNSIMRIFTKRGWSGDAKYSGTTVEFLENCHTGIRVYVIHEDRATANIYIYFPYPYFGGFYTIEGTYGEYKHICEYSTTAPEGQSQDVGYKTVEYNNYTNYEEQIGTWIDGKPIYRKCIDVSSLSQKIEVVSNISNIGRIIDIKASCKLWGNVLVTLTNVWAETDGEIWFEDDRFADITDLVIIIQYTKTTD